MLLPPPLPPRPLQPPLLVSLRLLLLLRPPPLPLSPPGLTSQAPPQLPFVRMALMTAATIPPRSFFVPPPPPVSAPAVTPSFFGKAHLRQPPEAPQPELSCGTAFAKKNAHHLVRFWNCVRPGLPPPFLLPCCSWQTPPMLALPQSPPPPLPLLIPV